MSTTSVHKQHLVSQVLLRRWAHEGKVLSLDLNYPTAVAKLRTPGQVGYQLDFIKNSSIRWEKRWSLVETRTPLALGAIDDGTLFEKEALVDVLKDLLAIHFARSVVVQAAWQASLASDVHRGHEMEIRACCLRRAPWTTCSTITRDSSPRAPRRPKRLR